MGCINVPSLPLQILLQTHSDWRLKPVAVVAEESPQSPILYVNRYAAAAGVRPGLRYAAGLSLTGELRAGTVSPGQIAKAVKRLTQCLQKFTPHVEPSAQDPGVLWLDVVNLHRLWPDPEQLSDEICRAIRALGFVACAVIGYTRFGTYAVAKGSKRSRVFADVQQERSAALRVSLARLSQTPGLTELLEQFAIYTVGEFTRLPSADILQRFGPEAYALYRRAAETLTPPLQPYPQEVTFEETIALEEPVSDVSALLFLIKGRLHRLLLGLTGRGQALAALTFSLTLEGQPAVQHSIRPATPTLDQSFVLDLLRLRLDSITLTAGVIGIGLLAQSSIADPQQLRLFNESTRRDPDAGNRALARIRAEYGETSVVKAILREGHLPEAQFAWEPLERITGPRSAPTLIQPHLIRRMHGKPVSVKSLIRKEASGTLAGTQLDERIVRLVGPDRVSGGWWHREVMRDYYYAETRSGELLWVYYDHQRDRWFLQGRVE